MRKLWGLLALVGLALSGLFISGSPAEATPQSYELIEYNARGERVASHGIIPANTWTNIQTDPVSYRCSGAIRMGTFGDGYAEFHTQDVDCDGHTGVAVRTEFFGQLPWSPAGCTYQNSYSGAANANTCDHCAWTGSGWFVRAHLPGTAVEMKIQMCRNIPWDPWYDCANTGYFGLLPH
jgi:hypothetical protein